jgi:hypothetical protein
MLHSANCVTRTGGSPANSTRTDTRLRAACANGGTPASGAGGRRGNRHSEVEHPDAWAHRYLDEQDRGYATAVRQMSTGAGGAANEKGAPASGCPLVWVCGYRCGALTCGWMSTTHAWWPKSVGMLIAEATLIGVSTAVAAWAGAARPRMAAMSPLAATAANPNLFIVMPSSFCLLPCSSRGAKSRFGGCVGR